MSAFSKKVPVCCHATEWREDGIPGWAAQLVLDLFLSGVQKEEASPTEQARREGESFEGFI